MIRTHPERTYAWVERLPAGITRVVGHDIRSTTAPVVLTNPLGGRVIFADTGCGKGGRLSWLDLPKETVGAIETPLAGCRAGPGGYTPGSRCPVAGSSAVRWISTGRAGLKITRPAELID